jgi:hypothetical protein
MSGYNDPGQFERIDDVLRKNYALTELLAQTFSAFVVGSNNKRSDCKLHQVDFCK